MGHDLATKVKSFSPTPSVGILTADLLNLGQEVATMEKAGVQVLHFDVMDGRFCPMLTMGTPMVSAIKTRMLKDVHLMIEEPLDLIPSFAKAGADIITFHVEATRHAHRILQVMGGLENANEPGRGIIRGVALNPGTPVEAIKPLLRDLELVLLLAVNPGWSGQSFIPATRDKLKQLLEMTRDINPDILIELDGGITKANIAEFKNTGVDLIVTGSAVFDGKTPYENARIMIERLG